MHVFAAVRSEKDIQKLNLQKRENKLRRLHPILIDVTKEEQIMKGVRTITEFTEKKGLPFIGLVNNAGMSMESISEIQKTEDVKVSFYFQKFPFNFFPKSMHKISGKKKAVFDVNVFGVMRMCKAFIPLLRKSNVSTIVQVSEISTFQFLQDV